MVARVEQYCGGFWLDETLPSLMEPRTIDLRPHPDGSLEGPIELSHDIATKARQAVVKIRTELGVGTGFLVQEEGQYSVVTAGHVVAGQSLDRIVITNSIGLRTYPEEGLFAYNGASQYGEEPGPDIAVLRLACHLGQSCLALGSLPKRGAWLSVISFQDNVPFSDPHQYRVMAAPRLDRQLYTPQSAYTHVISGIEPHRRTEPQKSQLGSNYSIRPGASGSPLIDMATGSVSGIITEDIGRLNNLILGQHLGVTINGVATQACGVEPRAARYATSMQARILARKLNQ